MNLATLDNVKIILGECTPDYDTELTLRLNAISVRAKHFCNRDFIQASYTEVHAGGESRIYPGNPPVISVTEIIWEDFGNFAAGYTIPSDEYFIVNRGWDIASSGGPFPGNEHGLQLEYVGGYTDVELASTTLPLDLQMAIAQQVTYEFRRRKDTGLTSVSMGNGDIIKVAERDFLPQVRDVLKNYQVPHIG